MQRASPFRNGFAIQIDAGSASTLQPYRRMNSLRPGDGRTPDRYDIFLQRRTEKRSARPKHFGHDFLKHEARADRADNWRQMRVAAPADRAERQEFDHNPTNCRAQNPPISADSGPKCHISATCSPANAPTMNTSPCARCKSRNTPKISVYPIATQSVGAAEHHPVGELLRNIRCASALRRSPALFNGQERNCRLRPRARWECGFRRRPCLCWSHQ